MRLAVQTVEDLDGGGIVKCCGSALDLVRVASFRSSLSTGGPCGARHQRRPRRHGPRATGALRSAGAIVVAPCPAGCRPPAACRLHGGALAPPAHVERRRIGVCDSASAAACDQGRKFAHASSASELSAMHAAAFGYFASKSATKRRCPVSPRPSSANTWPRVAPASHAAEGASAACRARWPARDTSRTAPSSLATRPAGADQKPSAPSPIATADARRHAPAGPAVCSTSSPRSRDGGPPAPPTPSSRPPHPNCHKRA